MDTVTDNTRLRHQVWTSAGPRRCPGRGCLTYLPDGRDLCHFCARTRRLAALGAVKECLRCHRSLPLLDFAGNGRFRLCDRCRDDYPMTEQERSQSRYLSPYYDLRRRRRQYRHRRAA